MSEPSLVRTLKTTRARNRLRIVVVALLGVVTVALLLWMFLFFKSQLLPGEDWGAVLWSAIADPDFRSQKQSLCCGAHGFIVGLVRWRSAPRPMLRPLRLPRRRPKPKAYRRLNRCRPRRGLRMRSKRARRAGNEVADPVAPPGTAPAPKPRTPTQLTLELPAPPATEDTPLVPVRMVNEWVYCPRLAFLEWVDGEWADFGEHRGGPARACARRCRRRPAPAGGRDRGEAAAPGRAAPRGTSAEGSCPPCPRPVAAPASAATPHPTQPRARAICDPLSCAPRPKGIVQVCRTAYRSLLTVRVTSPVEGHRTQVNVAPEQWSIPQEVTLLQQDREKTCSGGRSGILKPWQALTRLPAPDR